MPNDRRGQCLGVEKLAYQERRQNGIRQNKAYHSSMVKIIESTTMVGRSVVESWVWALWVWRGSYFVPEVFSRQKSPSNHMLKSPLSDLSFPLLLESSAFVSTSTALSIRPSIRLANTALG